MKPASRSVVHDDGNNVSACVPVLWRWQGWSSLFRVGCNSQQSNLKELMRMNSLQPGGIWPPVRILSARFITIIAAFGVFQAGFAQTYRIVDLGTPGNTGSYSDPHGINASGSVAGEWEATNSNFQSAFFYFLGTNLDLGGAGGTYAIAHAINDSNLIVGESGIGFTGFTHAFIYSNGVSSDLGTYGGNYSIAWAINKAGQAVGESTDSAQFNAEDQAIWWHDGVKTLLGTLTNGDYSSAHGINDSNVIVGESSAISGGVTNTYAFVYSSGVMSSLGSFPSGNYSSASCINNSGQIAGEAGQSNGDVHAFVIVTNGVMSDLGTFGGNYSTAAAINNSGVVVGYSLTASGEAHAFLCKGSTLLDLNNFIGSTVCTNLISADGINDSGQITGSGYTPAGDYHAFLLTPAITLSAPTLLANGQFSVTASGAPGERFVFQGTTDFSTWTSISTNTFSGSTFVCTDNPTSTNHYRFYRAMLLP
jgi:probable HAF family extracellular repeat protein